MFICGKPYAELGIFGRVARWLNANQKSQLVYILDGLGIENAVICYGHLIHFMTFWDII
jgi:hypothetical protein